MQSNVETAEYDEKERGKNAKSSPNKSCATDVKRLGK